ncbi:MAG: methyltransferase domain-containing protein [Acidimicrobiia bacterium]
MNLECRFCGADLVVTMVNLGMHPLCESFLTQDQLNDMEPHYPLHARVCGECFLVQIGEYVDPGAIFSDYAYFSSYSDSWLKHASDYVDMMTGRFELGSESRILEIASNDGYLLQYFQKKGIEVLGVDPAFTVAEAAIEKGIPTRVEFFDRDFATQLVSDGYRADVVLGNNVLAHGPDINGFVAGIPIVLADDGVATFEFPHLMRLMDENQFDTIYHEHWSYFSLATAQKIFASHGMEVFDVEELPSHGGSLRLFLKHASDTSKPVSDNVRAVLEREKSFGLLDISTYEQFSEKVKATKRALLDMLVEIKNAGGTIAIYGAAGKGNTLLNYCGIGTDFVDFASDRTPYKHGRYTPGTHIPIYDPDMIAERRPDYVLILAWNLKKEIMAQLSYIGEWGGKFIVPIPTATIYEAGTK